MSPKGPPFIFPILQKNGCPKTPKGPILHFLALCDLPETKEIQKKIRKKISEKNSKKIGNFFQFFPHADTVEENT